jgi:hypothetical protein
MLAGEKLGRRHQRGLRAGFDRLRHGDERDHRLAAADVALEQPHHAVRRGHVGADLRDRAPLRSREFERQRAEDAPAQSAVPVQHAASRSAQGAPHELERELVGEQLVGGEAAARCVSSGRIGVVRHMQPGERVAERKRRIVGAPFGKRGQPPDRVGGRLADDLVGQARGERVDRLEAGQSAFVSRRDDMVGMGDLRDAAVKLDPSRHHEGAPYGEHPLDIFPVSPEEDQIEFAGLVFGRHAVRNATARRSHMRGDPHVERRDLTFERLARVLHGHAAAPVDHGDRQVEQKIEDARACFVRAGAQQSAEQFPGCRADAAETAERSEERSENGRAHHLTGSRAACSVRASLARVEAWAQARQAADHDRRNR